jgi:hypothetical protein
MKDAWAKIRSLIRGEDECYWIEFIINGKEVTPIIPTEGIEEAERISVFAERVVRDAYDAGYKRGQEHLQKELRNLLGVK